MNRYYIAKVGGTYLFDTICWEYSGAEVKAFERFNVYRADELTIKGIKIVSIYILEDDSRE